MLMDNYRWLHAREPDNGCGGRLFWRSWIWTRHRLHAALPRNCLCMCHPLGRSIATQQNGANPKGSNGEYVCPVCVEEVGGGHCTQVDTMEKERRYGLNHDDTEWPTMEL